MTKPQDTFLLDIGLHPEAPVCCHRFSLFGMLPFLGLIFLDRSRLLHVRSVCCSNLLLRHVHCYFAFRFILTLGV